MNYCTVYKRETEAVFRNTKAIIEIFELNADCCLQELGVSVPTLSHVFAKYYLESGAPGILGLLLKKQREKLYEEARFKLLDQAIR